jgi:exosortase/archaeosortase family protein
MATADVEVRSQQPVTERVSLSARFGGAFTVTRLKPAIAIALILLAYRTSLRTLLDSLRLDTPLAHLALVPVLSLGLIWFTRRADPGPPIYDRQLDWIVGLPLVVAALGMNVVLPVRLEVQYWVWRIDLLTLPLFVAGLVSLMWGVRMLWKIRAAVLLLFLAWPYPYNLFVDKWLGRFTDLTISGVLGVLRFLPYADRVPGSESNFQITHGGTPFVLSIASACSGANGIVGFGLVGIAFMVVVKGAWWRRALWLLSGSGLLWILNVVRIMVVFWVARTWGETAAIDGVHPFAGLVVFNIGVAIMVLAMRLFGLNLKFVGSRTKAPAPLPPNDPRRHWYPAAMGFMVVAALLVGVYNGDLSQYDRVATSTGAPRLASFARSQETPEGWSLAQTNQYDWARQYYGRDSTWVRYMYTTQGTNPDLQANIPITADIIETSDRAALVNYGVESCYTFHGYSITGRQSVDLGSGVVGGILTWTNPDTELTWTTLYWHWPIASAGKTRYERITLIMNDQPTNKFSSPALDTGGLKGLQLDLNDAINGSGSPESVQRLKDSRQFLVNFARTMVDERAPADPADRTDTLD